ncbi:MAG TPA: hypothetical protein VIX73_30765 [Kofleriaceae bacterium]
MSREGTPLHLVAHHTSKNRRLGVNRAVGFRSVPDAPTIMAAAIAEHPRGLTFAASHEKVDADQGYSASTSTRNWKTTTTT